MWKLYFDYGDGGRIILTGKGTITSQMKEKYMKRYGSAEKAILQQYPKKNERAGNSLGFGAKLN